MADRLTPEEMIQEAADWAREHGYESSAEVYEQQLADRHAENTEQPSETQCTGQG